jgi:hypothetical protein
MVPAKAMRFLLVFFIVLAAGAGWLSQRWEHAILLAQASPLREAGRERATLHRERDRLRGLRSLAAEAESADRQTAAVPAEIAPSAVKPETPPPVVPALTIAQWIAAESWQNRGRATPRATLETSLWAAAGGDLATFKTTLTLEPDVREEAAGLLARLPEGSRRLYQTPEDLLAAFTIKNIPVGAAQLVWYHETSPDEAIMGLFLKNPPTAAGTADFSRPAETGPETADRRPPQLPAASNTGTVYLTLRRSDDGWRLVVPKNAVNAIARELGRVPAK